MGTNAAGLRHTYPEFLDREGLLEQSVAAMREAYQAGVRTMVEMSTFDLGRDIGLIQEVSRTERRPAHCRHRLPSGRAASLREVSPDVIARLYIREIEEGIEGTGIKAGLVKAASDRGGITPPQEVILRAVARTHQRTGVPITTHTWSPDRVGEQVRILEEEGVDLNRVYIGHSNDDTDLDYLLGLLKKGVWLGMDRYPGGRLPGTPTGSNALPSSSNSWTRATPIASCCPTITRSPKPATGRRSRRRAAGRTPMAIRSSPAGAAPSQGTGRFRPGYPPDHGGEPASVL